MDPLKIEGLYEKTKIDLRAAGSERIQLELIYRFVLQLEGNYLKYDSYLIQIFEKFPELTHPLLFTGIEPTYLKKVIDNLERVVGSIPELQNDDMLSGKLNHLRDGLEQINSWLGINSGKNAMSQLVVRSGASSEKTEDGKEVSEVFIPVLERSGNADDLGRLRKLQVEVIGESMSSQHELRPTFGVIGARSANLVEEAVMAAGHLLNETTGDARNWTGTASFEMGHAWHAGRSANAALSALFYCEMLRAENRREYYALNSSIAITGDVDEVGTVLEVDGHSIKKKIESVFYSWVQILVVPNGQLEQAYEEVEKLQIKYPERHLIIKGIGHIKDLFYDRRLSFYFQTSYPRHIIREAWKRKNSVVVTFLVTVLLLVISGLLYGPIDKNPVVVEFSGEHMHLLNSYGNKLESLKVGERTVRNVTANSYRQPAYYSFSDVDEDGENEFFWAGQSGNHMLFLYASDIHEGLLWKQSFTESLEYKEHPYINNSIQMITYIESSDLDGDGDVEVIVSTCDTHYFSSFVYVLDAESGKVEHKYLHHGRVTGLQIFDVNDDGLKDILFYGLNNHYRTGIVGILDIRTMDGQGVAGKRYQAENYPKAEEIYYLLIPRSIPDSTIEGRPGFETEVRNARWINQDELLVLEVQESYDDSHPSYSEIIGVQYSFDSDFNLLSLGSTNMYDRYAEEIYETGKADFLADGRYLETFKDSLWWWSGKNFKHLPTLNERYLGVFE